MASPPSHYDGDLNISVDDNADRQGSSERVRARYSVLSQQLDDFDDDDNEWHRHQLTKQLLPGGSSRSPNHQPQATSSPLPVNLKNHGPGSIKKFVILPPPVSPILAPNPVRGCLCKQAASTGTLPAQQPKKLNWDAALQPKTPLNKLKESRPSFGDDSFDRLAAGVLERMRVREQQIRESPKFEKSVVARSRELIMAKANEAENVQVRPRVVKPRRSQSTHDRPQSKIDEVDSTLERTQRYENSELPERPMSVALLRDRWEASSKSCVPLKLDSADSDLLAAAVRIATWRKTDKPKPLMSILLGSNKKSENTSTKPPHAKPVLIPPHTNVIWKPESVERPPTARLTVAPGIAAMAAKLMTRSKDDEVESEKENSGSKNSGSKSSFLSTPKPFVSSAKRQEQNPIIKEPVPSPPMPSPPPVDAILSPAIQETHQRLEDRQDEENPVTSMSPATSSPQEFPPGMLLTPTELTDGDAHLPHSVSFYRKRRGERQAAMAQSASMPVFVFPQQLQQHNRQDMKSIVKRLSSSVANADENRMDEHHPETDDSDDVFVERRLRQLQTEVEVQRKRESQARRALALCRHTAFRGSREEVDAQRALLLANQRVDLLQGVIAQIQRQRIENDDGGRTVQSTSTGSLTISRLTVPVAPDWERVHAGPNGQNLQLYILILVKCDDALEHTSLLTADDLTTQPNGRLAWRWPESIRFRKVPAEFQLELEVYTLEVEREQVPYETKYRLPSASSSASKPKIGAQLSSALSTIRRKANKDQNGDTTAGGGGALSTTSIEEEAHKLAPHASPTTAAARSAFRCAGRLRLDIHNCVARRYQFERDDMITFCDALVQSPVAGDLELRIVKKCDRLGAADHADFLSLYQRRDGPGALGDWPRYWSRLRGDGGVLSFWHAPEDDAGGKRPLLELDLSMAACTATEVTQQIFPNSMQLDVYVTDSQKRKCERLRVFLAADTPTAAAVWLEALNATVIQALNWGMPMQQPHQKNVE